MHTIVPFLLFDNINWAFVSFCSGQKDVPVIVVSTVGGLVWYGICMFIFVYQLEMGFKGLSWATAVMYLGRFTSV